MQRFLHLFQCVWIPPVRLRTAGLQSLERRLHPRGSEPEVPCEFHSVCCDVCMLQGHHGAVSGLCGRETVQGCLTATHKQS